jgi:hypothetical protein
MMGLGSNWAYLFKIKAVLNLAVDFRYSRFAFRGRTAGVKRHPLQSTELKINNDL